MSSRNGHQAAPVLKQDIADELVEMSENDTIEKGWERLSKIIQEKMTREQNRVFRPDPTAKQTRSILGKVPGLCWD